MFADVLDKSFMGTPAHARERELERLELLADERLDASQVRVYVTGVAQIRRRAVRVDATCVACGEIGRGRRRRPRFGSRRKRVFVGIFYVQLGWGWTRVVPEIVGAVDEHLGARRSVLVLARNHGHHDGTECHEHDEEKPRCCLRHFSRFRKKR